MSPGLRIWNIEKEEKKGVFLLLIQSVFIGIFAGAFDVGAHSLFLNVFEASLIPKAYVLTGLVGILITSVYARLQNRMKFSNFILLNLIFVVVLTFLLRVGFKFTQDKRFIFATFVMMGPLTIISFLGFWGTVGRIFSLRQGKRLFGLIDTGQVVGIVMCSFAIPILIKFHFNIIDTLLISAISIFFALISQMIINRNYNLETRRLHDDKTTGKRTLIDLFREKYTSLMALFVVMSVLTAFFVHFSFLSVLKENYPEPDTRASFFGAFMGALTIFTIIIKTFVYDKLIKTYGLKVALMLSPLLVILFTAIASLVGGISGFTIASGGFAFFFLLIALSKLFAKSLKDSIEVPSSKILYQSLDANIRYDVQARIDGTVNELAALSAGLMLIGLGLITWIAMIHYSYFLLIILLVWIFIAIRLYLSYKESLQSSLSKFRQSGISDPGPESVLEKIIVGSDENKILSVLKFVPQTWNGFILKNIAALLASGKELQRFTLAMIERLNLFEAGKELKVHEESSSGEEKELIHKMLEKFTITDRDLKDDNLKQLLKSDKAENRKRGLMAIIQKNDSMFYPRVVPMFRDADHSVRISAIRTAGILGKKDFASYLIDLLEDPEFYPYAFNALCSMGDDILENLEHGFHKTYISEKGMVRITKVISRIGTPRAALLLLNKLEYINLNVLKEALKGLVRIDVSLSESEKLKVFDAIYRVSGVAAWNQAALYSARQAQVDGMLIQALEDELTDNFNLVFGLLSVAYDRKSIYHIRKSIEGGTSEGIGFAIELLDILVDENMKAYLFPLLDDSVLPEKIAQLQYEFPIEITGPVDLLINIINRDCNQISTYTKVCALELLGQQMDYHLSKDVIAQMFNADKILQELACFLVYKKDKEICNSVLLRCPENSANAIRDFLSLRDIHLYYGETGKFKLLRKSGIFNFLNNPDQLEIARRFELIILDSQKECTESQIKFKNSIIFILDGELDINDSSKRISIQPAKLFRFPDWNFSEELQINYKGRKIFVMSMKEEVFRELIFDHEDSFFPVTEWINEINTNPEYQLN